MSLKPFKRSLRARTDRELASLYHRLYPTSLGMYGAQTLSRSVMIDDIAEMVRSLLDRGWTVSDLTARYQIHLSE